MANGMPADVTKDLSNLVAALDATLPTPKAKNLMIATWNLRVFGGYTDKWNAGPNDSPTRDLGSLACIAEVIGRFDVVALEEVRRDVSALRRTVEMLGPDWRFIVSDVTEGDAGNDERLAFLYNTTRVQPSGLVGEIVLPISPGSVERQFARTPYVVGFTAGTTDFILTTLHILWGPDSDATGRLKEIRGIAKWMRAWADRRNDWNKNLLVLGDFNIDRVGDPLYEAFLSTGLWPPPELDLVPRTIFEVPGKHHHYDQIVWFADEQGNSLLDSLTFTHECGSVDFVPYVMTDLSKTSLSFKISDHRPLWVEFDRQ
jgi:hypothetical protein